MIINKNSDFWKCSHGMVGTEGSSCPDCQAEDEINGKYSGWTIRIFGLFIFIGRKLTVKK